MLLVILRISLQNIKVDLIKKLLLCGYQNNYI